MQNDGVNVNNGFFKAETLVLETGLPPVRPQGDTSGAAFGNLFVDDGGGGVEIRAGMILFSDSYIDPEKEKQAARIRERLGVRTEIGGVEIGRDGRPERKQR